MSENITFLRKFMVLSALALGTLSIGLCTGNENFREFRTTAGPGFQSGLQTILTGGEQSADGFTTILQSALDGLFAIIEPDSATGRP